jgi:hypothetical protein
MSEKCKEKRKDIEEKCSLEYPCRKNPVIIKENQGKHSRDPLMSEIYWFVVEAEYEI